VALRDQVEASTPVASATVVVVGDADAVWNDERRCYFLRRHTPRCDRDAVARSTDAGLRSQPQFLSGSFLQHREGLFDVSVPDDWLGGTRKRREELATMLLGGPHRP